MPTARASRGGRSSMASSSSSSSSVRPTSGDSTWRRRERTQTRRYPGGGRRGRGVRMQTRATVTLANVQVATGATRRDTRARLMRAFNTPFFPDILVCSEVMGEGVDLQRFCRHVIHHDLAWNPSTHRAADRPHRPPRMQGRRPPADRRLSAVPGRHGRRAPVPGDVRSRAVVPRRDGAGEVARLITPDSSIAYPCRRASRTSWASSSGCPPQSPEQPPSRPSSCSRRRRQQRAARGGRSRPGSDQRLLTNSVIDASSCRPRPSR